MEKDLSDKLQRINMIFTAVFWMVLSIICLSLMYYVASNKTIVIADTKGESIGLAADGAETGNPESSIVLNGTEEATGEFTIPLQKGIKAENVVAENNYIKRELRIYIEGASAGFYAERAVSGDIGTVAQCHCEIIKDGVILVFEMDGIYEYHTTMNDDAMSVSFERPADVYGLVVVIDPMGGGTETGNVLRGYAEKTLALQIAEKLPDMLSSYGDICVFLTRTEDTLLSTEERLAFAYECGADLYIRIGVSSDSDESLYGIMGIYNEEYFIPEFGNVELADALTRRVTIAAGNRAVGLVPSDEDSILSMLTIPAAQINVGYFTNEREAALLSRDDYREKLAQGIADAIIEAGGKMQ